jgi:hypothetical protein
METPLISGSLNRFHCKRANVYRIDTAFASSQPRCHQRTASWAAAEIQDCHAGVYTCLLEYLDGWTRPIVQTKLHRLSAERQSCHRGMVWSSLVILPASCPGFPIVFACPFSARGLLIHGILPTVAHRIDAVEPGCVGFDV